MPFINPGEASETSRQSLAHLQSLAELILQLAELASQKAAEEPKQDQDQSDVDPFGQPLEGDGLADSLVQNSELRETASVVQRLSQGKEDGLVYQAEGFSVFRHEELTGTIYEVTAPDGDPLLIFEQVGSELHLIDDRLPPDLKASLLNASAMLSESDVAVVLNHPDPRTVVSAMGDASPAGTRAAWVAQQVLRGRDTYTPDKGNFQFDRDQSTGNLTVTDRTNNHVLLSVTPEGQVTCTMSAEQLSEFRPAYDRLQSFQSHVVAKSAKSKSSSRSGSQQLALER